jgi:hypothetical protein
VVDAGYRPVNAPRKTRPVPESAGSQFAIIELQCPIMTFRWLYDSRHGPEVAQKLLDSTVNSAAGLLGIPTKE